MKKGEVPTKEQFLRLAMKGIDLSKWEIKSVSFQGNGRYIVELLEKEEESDDFGGAYTW